MCWAENNFNIFFNFKGLFFFCHICLLCSFSSHFLPLCRKLIIWVDRPLPLWALQVRWISLLLCKQIFSLFTHICIHECSHTLIHVIISAFLLLVYKHLSCVTCIYTCTTITHVCTQSDSKPSLASPKPAPSEAQSSARLLNPPTLSSSIPATPNFSLLWSLSDYIDSSLCLHLSFKTLSLFLQVLVAFISFSETMLVVYLSYKVSYSWSPTVCVCERACMQKSGECCLSSLHSSVCSLY